MKYIEVNSAGRIHGTDGIHVKLLLLLLAILPFAFWPWGIDPNLIAQALLLAVFLLQSAAGAVRGRRPAGDPAP